MRRALFLTLLLTSAAASAQNHPCAVQDGATYWMRERYSGIDVQRDVGDERQWAPNGPGGCFRTPLREIEQPLVRNWGYRLAVEEFAKLLPFDQKKWDAPKSVAVRTKLAALVGRDFASRAELEAWWGENIDYLTWSEEAGRLVVDERAKAAGQPVTTRNVEKTIGADLFWRVEAKGDVRDRVDDGTSIHGIAWTGDHHDPEIRFRIDKSELLDRQTKESAYRQAVAEMVATLGESGIGAQSTAQLRNALARVTGQRFADARSWIAWWSAHRNDAHLDAQGLRLTTGSN